MYELHQSRQIPICETTSPVCECLNVLFCQLREAGKHGVAMLLCDVELVGTALKVEEIATVAVHHIHVYYLRTADADKAVGRKNLLHLLKLETDRNGTCTAQVYMAVIVVRLNPFYLAVAYLYLVVVVNGFYKKSVFHHFILLSCFHSVYIIFSLSDGKFMI